MNNSINNIEQGGFAQDNFDAEDVVPLFDPH